MNATETISAICGVLMLAAALYSATRIVVAVIDHRITDIDLDVCHVIMGVAMAGMLIPALHIVENGISSTIWATVFAIIAVWFAVSLIREGRRTRDGQPFRAHHLPHLLFAIAMVTMLAPAGGARSSGGTAMAGMAGMASASASSLLSTAALVLCLFMFGYAVVVLDRLPLIAVAGTGHLRVVGHAVEGGNAVLLAPRSAAMINVAMATVMGYMLVLML